MDSARDVRRKRHLDEELRRVMYEVRIRRERSGVARVGGSVDIGPSVWSCPSRLLCRPISESVVVRSTALLCTRDGHSNVISLFINPPPTPFTVLRSTMILSRRAPSSHIPSPLSSELAPCPLASPPIIPPRPHKHSFSKPMSWLNRSSSSVSTHSISQGTPKTSRISEPKVGSSLDQFIFHRSGQLGSGATIVRTPQEALSGSFRVFEVTNEAQEVEQDTLPQNHTEQEETTLLPPLPPSPPLPPLPDISDTRGEAGGSSLSVGSTSVPLSDHASHSRSSGSTSPKTHRSSSRPTMLAHSRMPSRATAAPVVDTDVVPPQPPFEAILLSPTPDGPTDPSKIIVTLETCTTTYRASLRTLVSRPSHLSRYLTSLLSPVSETASLYSNSSDASLVQYKNGFSSVFRDHFASSGCLPRSPNTIHVFLDRPSAP